MKVLYVASEALPFMASGGLGDVAGSLPVALRKRLIGCRVVMPLYDGIKQEFKDQMKFITSISVPVSWRRQYCGIFEPRLTASFTISLTTNIISNVTEFMAIMTMPNVLHSLQEQYLKLFLLLIGNLTSFTATIGKVH